MAAASSYGGFVDNCPRCRAELHGPSKFCTACGTALSSAYVQPEPLTTDSPQHVASRGFAQMFGLLPGMALLTLVVDAMLFPPELVSMGTSFPISLAASLVLGAIVFLAQRKWYGDDDESAAIKALMVAFLTAIPTPLPAMLYVPAGIVGFFRRNK